MSGEPDGQPPQPVDEERLRRRAEVFGDVLPEATSDERDDPSEPQASDEWLRRQVPPHHG